MKIKKIFEKKLTKKEADLVPSSFDIVGDILIFSDFPEELKKKEKKIAKILLDNFKNVKVVCKKTKKYSGKYRTPKFKIIGGENRKITEHKENNTRIKINIEKCYFSPRTSTERKRIYQKVKKNEEILVMFSGVAPLPCVLSKNSNPKNIVGIEVNPEAHKFGVENVKINKLNNVELIKGDVKKIIPKLTRKFNRILMPLPKGAEKFLKEALNVAKKGTIIHLYNFGAEEEIKQIKENIEKICKENKKKIKFIQIVKCGSFSPGVYRLCFDFKVL